VTSFLDPLNLDASQRRAVQLWCYRQAAKQFAAVGRFREAAGCWAKAGETAQAVDLLLEQGDWAEAARLLWDQQRYAEALECYQRWPKVGWVSDPTQSQDTNQGAAAGSRSRGEADRLEAYPTNDAEISIRSDLGIAACLVLLNEHPERGHELSLAARSRIESAELRPGGRSRCWRAVGEYGYRVARWDLVHVGYELALRDLGVGDLSRESARGNLAPDGRRVSHAVRRDVVDVLREYLRAAAGNRSLEQRLREQLAEFESLEISPKPQGADLEAAARQIGPPRKL
jgi:tetratricopeptide (TPR) repeat protein